MSEKDLADATIDLPTLASAEALAVVPGYTLIRMRDETALLRTYECRSERSGDFVLVYVLQKDVAADAARKTRALRDSRLIMALRSQKHLQKVVEVGEGAAGSFIIVELPSVAPLSSVLEERGRMSVLEALESARDAARALESAHQAGVIHRDITPHRLWRAADGSYKLGGFGFAAPLEAEGAAAGLVGSPEVTAPELIKGGAPDAKSDIYALGATLFWLITGRPIFSGPAAEVLAAQQKKPVPSISSLVPDAGITVVDILYRLLQKDPARRPQTAGELAALLENAVSRVQRESAAPGSAAAAPGGFSSAPSSSAYAAPPRAPAAKLPSRTELAMVPPTGSSPFDTASTDGDPYVGQPTGVMGSLKQMSVTEILQTLEIGKKSARVDVQTIDGLKGTIHIHDGQIVHASSPTTVGEAVIGLLIRKTEGFFRIHYEKEQCERNITRPTQFVLLEAMRMMDEAKVAAPAPAPSPPPSAAVRTVVDTSPTAPEKPSPRSAPAVKDAVVVRRPVAERVPLARPLDAAASAATDAAASQEPAASAERAASIGDGIEREGGVEPRGIVEEATMPQVPTRGVRAKALALQGLRGAKVWTLDAWRASSDVTSQFALRVMQRAPVWNADAEEKFAPLRPRLSRVHPRLGTLPLWQIAVTLVTVLACLLIVVTAL